VTPRTILRLSSARAQAEYLSHLRADAIVADAEFIRRRLLGEDSTWSVLGQSYGGFCILHYLSVAPDNLAAAYITGGLGPLDAPAEEVYQASYAVVRAKNTSYHHAFPDDQDRLERIAAYLA
jgi:pimeloyl-ACP methyl ester carboxylesterase